MWELGLFSLLHHFAYWIAIMVTINQLYVLIRGRAVVTFSRLQVFQPYNSFPISKQISSNAF